MTKVQFGLDEAKQYPNLYGRINPALEAFGKDVASVVTKGLTHKPTKWRVEFYDRIPAYFIQFTTTDKSDFEVEGWVNLIFDFEGGVAMRYRVEIETQSAMYGPAKNKKELKVLGSMHADYVGKQVVEYLRSLGNV